MATSDGAVITAGVAVVVAIVTQVWTSLRSRTDRRYASRRAGLVEAQDALLDLRQALAAYGVGIRPGNTGTASLTEPGVFTAAGDDLETRKRDATGRFLTCMSRVHDDVVVSAMTVWRSAAERRFISVEEVSAHVEDEWFDHVQTLSRAALRSSSGAVGRRARRRITAPAPLVGD